MTDTTTKPTAEESAAERFARDTAGHTMTVLHDEGLYRHVKFANPSHGMYWFELVTSPGQIAFGGDMDSFVFRRAEDMFEFFRRGGPRPDPGYLSQKVVAGADRTRAWSPEAFRATALEAIAAAIEDHDLGAADQAMCRAEFANDVLGDALDFQETALRAADEFAFAYGHPDRGRRVLVLSDVYEWDCTAWNWSFLWALEAITWGVNQYEQARHAQIMTLLRETPPLELASRLLRAEAARTTPKTGA
jgi:hypothetical protein